MTLPPFTARRRSPVLTAFCCSAFVLASTAIAQANPPVESGLVFERVAHTVDVGYYPRDFFVDFLFEVRGDAPVTIRSSSSTCPCTTVASDKTTYYPGQKGVIGAVYSYRGNTAPEMQPVRVLTDRSPHAQVLTVIPRQATNGLWVERHELHWAGAPAQLAQKVEIEVSPELQGQTPVVELAVTSWRATVEPIEPTGRFRLTIQPLSDRAPAAQAIVHLSPGSDEGKTPYPNPQVTIDLFPAAPPPRT